MCNKQYDRDGSERGERNLVKREHNKISFSSRRSIRAGWLGKTEKCCPSYTLLLGYGREQNESFRYLVVHCLRFPLDLFPACVCCWWLLVKRNARSVTFRKQTSHQSCEISRGTDGRGKSSISSVAFISAVSYISGEIWGAVFATDTLKNCLVLEIYLCVQIFQIFTRCAPSVAFLSSRPKVINDIFGRTIKRNNLLFILLLDVPLAFMAVKAFGPSLPVIGGG